MGGETTDATISGAKDAGGNAVFPPPPHMSISLAPSSGLSPPSDDVTAAYIRLLQRRDDERDNELAALRAEVAQMKQRMQLDDTPATSRSGGGGRGPRRTPPPPPPPPPQERPHETLQRGSVKDRLGFTPETGDAREIILYKKPTASGNHPPRSTHDRNRTRDSESFTSTYSTGRAEFSRTVAEALPTPGVTCLNVSGTFCQRTKTMKLTLGEKAKKQGRKGKSMTLKSDETKRRPLTALAERKKI